MLKMFDAQEKLMTGGGRYFTVPLQMVMTQHEGILSWEIGVL